MKAVNLIPQEERGSGGGMGVGRSGGAVYAVFGLLVGLALMAFLYGSAAHKVSSDKAEVASLQARAQEAQTKTAALAPYTSFVSMREQREQAVEQLVDSRFDWAQAFHEFSRVLPTNVSLSSLDGTIGSSSGSGTSAKAGAASSTSASSSSVSSSTPPGSVPTFTLAGCTTSQANVAVVLNRLRLINGVHEATLQSSTKSGSSAGSSSSSGGSGGGCGNGGVTFNMTVTFDALPTLSATGSSSTSTVASASDTPSSTSNATTTGAPR
jgi:Tfp pilus assembly protein PilN